ncbi:MAG: hypothetical protein ABR587_07325 [Candidatus Binatia bacterium]
MLHLLGGFLFLWVLVGTERLPKVLLYLALGWLVSVTVGGIFWFASQGQTQLWLLYAIGAALVASCLLVIYGFVLLVDYAPGRNLADLLAGRNVRPPLE